MLQMIMPQGRSGSPDDLDADRVDFRLVHAVHRLRSVLSIAALMLGFLVMSGHVLGIRWLYQPIPGGGGTHLVTVTMVVLLGAVLFAYRPARRMSPWLVGMTAVALAIAVLTQAAALLPDPGPGAGLLPRDLAEQAGQVRVGANTATSVILVAWGLLMQRRHSSLGFALTGAGLFPPTVACLGYVYDLQSLHGATSPVTAAMLLLVSLAAITTFAHKRTLRVLLRGDISGQLARWQMFVANLFIVVSGFAFSVIDELGGLAKMAVFAGIGMWFVNAMLIISAQIHEKADHRRRMRERRLVAYSVTEPLTGLANRRAGQEFGGIMFEQSVRAAEALSALMIDLDHFKQVNDLHGHAAGDDVLCQVARVLARRLRRSDLVARWGGEEFLVLLPAAEEADARAVAEEIRQLIAAEVRCAGDDTRPVTASIGVAARCAADAELDTLLDRVDVALYAAKESGRDQVVSCSDVARSLSGDICTTARKGPCGHSPTRKSRGSPCETCFLGRAKIASIKVPAPPRNRTGDTSRPRAG